MAGRQPLFMNCGCVQMLDSLWLPRTGAGPDWSALERLAETRGGCDTRMATAARRSPHDARAAHTLVPPPVALPPASRPRTAAGPAHRALSMAAVHLTPQVSVQYRGSRPFFHIQPPAALHTQVTGNSQVDAHARANAHNAPRPLQAMPAVTTSAALHALSEPASHGVTRPVHHGRATHLQTHAPTVHTGIQRPVHATVQLAQPAPLPRLRSSDSLQHPRPTQSVQASPNLTSSVAMACDHPEALHLQCRDEDAATRAPTAPAPCVDGFDQALRAVIGASSEPASDLDLSYWGLDSAESARLELSLDHPPIGDSILEEVFRFHQCISDDQPGSEQRT